MCVGMVIESQKNVFMLTSIDAMNQMSNVSAVNPVAIMNMEICHMVRMIIYEKELFGYYIDYILDKQNF